MGDSTPARPRVPAPRVLAPRVLALWCPDWPASAAATAVDLAPGRPVAVVHAGRVIACSPVAREQGIRRGMRKRQAQSTCPDLMLAVADDDRDGRFFDPVVAAVGEIVPTVEVLRPGLLVTALPEGLHRHVGPEAVLAEKLVDAVAVLGSEAQVGAADEMFTAILAARRGQFVASGGDREYLAPLPVDDLAVEPSFAGSERVELVDVLRRLGIKTLGMFADLRAGDVATRFTADAVVAHRLARGTPDRAPASTVPPEELVVEHICDPPVDRVDAAAFLGRQLSEQLHHLLAARSVACTRLTVEAITELGQRYSRTWRCARPLAPADTADRIRWQLEGWLVAADRPDSPIVTLRLEPVETVDAGALHHILTGAGLPESDECSERARRALVRVQGLLGGEAVKVPVLSGGRGPGEQVTLVTLGDELVPEREPDAPWPGRLPQPTPTVVIQAEVEVLGAEGRPVKVSERGAFTAEPVTVYLERGSRRSSWAVQWWAGPWPTGLNGRQVTARAQVLLDDRRALLLHFRSGAWMVEGVYE